MRISNGYNASFLFGYGLFNDTWAPLTEAAINIITAIIAGTIWGLPGVLLGNFFSFLLIVCVWKPYFLYSKGFKMPSYSYWLNILIYLLIFIIACIISSFITSLVPITKSIYNYWALIQYAVVCILIYSVIFTLLMSIWGRGFKSLIVRFFF